jgi:hypothetical protein
MYRKGLSRDQIAMLAGAARSTVGYHLKIARTLEPGLDADHAAAARPKPAHATPQGLERMHQLVSWVEDTGAYPSRQSPTETERALAAWLQRRREDARAGKLAQEYREGLAVLPGWETAPRAEADEARWHQRLAALTAYRAAGHDWPRHKAATTGVEHDLGVWLHSQRAKFHRGELDEEKVQDLDRILPGWREGRQRGRKPLTGTESCP